MYLADQKGKHGYINRPAIGQWEKFLFHKTATLSKHEIDVGMRGGYNNKWCANEIDDLKCDRGRLGHWETYRLKCVREDCEGRWVLQPTEKSQDAWKEYDFCKHCRRPDNECSEPCGGGVKTYKYKITNNAKHGGAQCPHASGKRRTENCNQHACPVHCSGHFTPWSECTRTCVPADKMSDAYKDTVSHVHEVGGSTPDTFHFVW